MSPVSTIGHVRNRSRECIAALVSVEGAAQLQDLSMRRFQQEASGRSKLGRILGHISVNRRSTEIIKTMTIQEDTIEQLVDQSAYDEDAPFSTSLSPEPVSVPSSPRAEAASDRPEDQWTQLSPQEEQIISAISPIIDTLREYQPDSDIINVFTAESDAILAMDENWMYDVLDLHIDYDALTNPIPVVQLSKSVVVQLWWRIILESLAKFSRRNQQLTNSHDLGHVEAFGNHDYNDVVGLGLLCKPMRA